MRLLVSIAAAIWILVAARSVLQPIAIAILVWFVLSATARQYQRLLPGAPDRAGRLAKLASVVTFCLGLFVLGSLVADNVAQVRRNLPTYEANLDRLLAAVSETLGLQQKPELAQLIEGIDFNAITLNLVGSAAGYLGSLMIVICYLVFIFIETEAFTAKLAAIEPEAARRRRLDRLLQDIRRGVETYLGVQCLIGVIQGAATFAVLALVGVDGPFFWAVVIFALSFIPTIGSLVGIAFPALMALLQFQTLTPFLIVAPTVAVVQLYCSNWLQPRLTGKSLNLSALAVFIAIFAGGAVWGIVGALIAVPVLSIVVIACAQVPSLRSVAIALSADGRLPELHAPADG